MPQTILDWPLVKRGDDHFPVRSLQDLLRARGHSVAVDGIFGPKTDQWVRGFQDAVGTTVDGIVGPITWRAMVSGMLSG
jgi:peptidoglycan hydrolase-like protein with peptidoglycan-binding domain